MRDKIITYMVVKNISKKEELIKEVILQASKISKFFYIVNHGSDDSTIEILKNIGNEYDLHLEIINEKFIGTMDDMKGKYYKILKENYGNEKKYILILDWDEVLDNKLVNEIINVDFKYDVYLLNINTYLINNVIDRNHFQPRLFEINSVEVNSFSKFHNLFNVKSRKIKKMKGIIHHYSYSGIKDLFNKNIFYSKGEAEYLYDNNKNISNLMIFLRYLFEGTSLFLYTLLYHGNYKHLEGWLYSINWYTYKFNKYMFYLELKLKEEGKK